MSIMGKTVRSHGARREKCRDRRLMEVAEERERQGMHASNKIRPHQLHKYLERLEQAE